MARMDEFFDPIPIPRQVFPKMDVITEDVDLQLVSAVVNLVLP